MRYLAIDLGDQRTGLAVGDDQTSIISPWKVLQIPRGPLLMDALAKAIADHAPDALVIGLPLNMDGTEGAAAKTTRELGDALAEQTELAIHYQDERLTTSAADEQMARSGKTHKQKKAIRDALAAAEILRDFLDARS